MPVTPVDGNPPLSVAWSVTAAPTVIVENGMIEVVTAGACLLIVKSSHELVTGLLVASPLYVALKLYRPAPGINDADAGIELPESIVTVCGNGAKAVDGGPEH